MQNSSFPVPDAVKLSSRLNRKLFWGIFVLFQILLIGIAFLAGYLIHDWLPSQQADDFPVLNRAYKVLSDNAYNSLPDSRALQYGMIRGMLQAFNDPYTSFLEPPQQELQSNQLEGHFGGIGVRIERDAENLVYLYPLPNSAAAEAGIQEGDRLLAIDMLIVAPATPIDTIQAAIRGPVGEAVKITVGRQPDFTPILLTVKRGDVPLPSVTFNLAPDYPTVGLVQINVIADTTPDEVDKAIIDLEQRGATHFVLDVRNNGGGLVDAGVNTARLFLNQGEVIQEQYRDQPVKTYSVEKPGSFSSLPIVILVNKGTASAAEIFAGALQGQKRALLVGSPTYGKDSIQLVFDLGDGSSLHVTAARWWVPNHRDEIRGMGLQPDVLASEDDLTSQPLQKAIEILLKQ